MKLQRSYKAIEMLRAACFTHGTKRERLLERFGRFMRRSRITFDDLAHVIASGHCATNKLGKTTIPSRVTSERKRNRVATH